MSSPWFPASNAQGTGRSGRKGMVLEQKARELRIQRLGQRLDVRIPMRDPAGAGRKMPKMTGVNLDGKCMVYMAYKPIYKPIIQI